MVDENGGDKGREYNNIFAKEDFEDNYKERTIDSSCEQVSCITSEYMNLRFVIITKEKDNKYIDDFSSSTNTSKLKVTRTTSNKNQKIVSISIL